MAGKPMKEKSTDLAHASKRRMEWAIANSIDVAISHFAHQDAKRTDPEAKAAITRTWHPNFLAFMALLVQAGAAGVKRNPIDDFSNLLRAAFPEIDCKSVERHPNHVILITLFIRYEKALRQLPVYQPDCPERGPHKASRLNELFARCYAMAGCPDSETLSILHSLPSDNKGVEAPEQEEKHLSGPEVLGCVVV
jgi:hypothetical protein